MRKIDGLTEGVTHKFVPVSYGNDKDTDPVTVWIRTPTERDRREMLSLNEVDDESLSSLIRSQHATISKLVTKVENYQTSSGNAIKDGVDLSTHGETPIIAEVYVKIISFMFPDEDHKKKSESPPG